MTAAPTAAMGLPEGTARPATNSPQPSPANADATPARAAITRWERIGAGEGAMIHVLGRRMPVFQHKQRSVVPGAGPAKSRHYKCGPCLKKILPLVFYRKQI